LEEAILLEVVEDIVQTDLSTISSIDAQPDDDYDVLEAEHQELLATDSMSKEQKLAGALLLKIRTMIAKVHSPQRSRAPVLICADPQVASSKGVLSSML
jgi:hypothetical protein